MKVLIGFFNVLLGAFFVWMGAFQLITAMLPDDVAINVAGEHGRWMRENVFRLPPVTEKENTP